MPGNMSKVVDAGPPASGKHELLFAVGIVLLAAAAFAFRYPRLGERPFHGDEANQAVKTGHLLEDGEYAYDPHEHHGPTLYYAALVSLRLAGAHTLAESDERMFRMVPLVFGVGVLLLIGTFGSGLGRSAALLAALFTALSPAMVYFSRYFIQETLFVCFSLAALAAGWRYAQRPSWWAAALAGIALALMHATKETCVVLFFAMAGALAGTWLLARWRRTENETTPRGLPEGAWKHLALFIAAGAACSVTFFSSFFTHPRGVLDSVLTYANYLGRADGGGSAAVHNHPWYFYFELLGFTYRSAGPKWSEGLLLGLGSVGILAALLRRNTPTGSIHFQRFLALYTVLATAVFCMIPYKTPWNLLPFYQAWILMAGVGAAFLFRAVRGGPVRLKNIPLAPFKGGLGIASHEVTVESACPAQSAVEDILFSQPASHDDDSLADTPSSWTAAGHPEPNTATMSARRKAPLLNPPLKGGRGDVLRCSPWRSAAQALLAVLLAAGLAHLGRQAYLASYVYAADIRNPWVYAHTSTALFRMIHDIDAVAALQPDGPALQINVIQPDGDYWPLPWYLRRHTRVGYWPRIPDAPDAPFIIADMRLGPELQTRLQDQYFTAMQALRPSVLRLLYIRKDLWDAYIQTRINPAP